MCVYIRTWTISSEETELIIHDHLLLKVPDPDDFYRLELEHFRKQTIFDLYMFFRKKKNLP